MTRFLHEEIRMKVAFILRKLELKKNNSTEALALLEFLKKLDPDATLQWRGDATQDGVHVPVDAEGNILFDKKRIFREGEPFPEDEYYWVPYPLM
jgi:hypothetical protein